MKREIVKLFLIEIELKHTYNMINYWEEYNYWEVFLR